MHVQLLIDSGEFWSALEQDIRTARQYIYIQTLSFEGDRTGERLGEVLLSHPVPDRRLLVDNYTRLILSDRLLFAPHNLLNRPLQREHRNTYRLIRRLRRGGVRVRFGGPLGKFFHRLPARDHKKLIVIDDHIAYIGGINFSDHNFEWHDMMIRFQHSGMAHFLKTDFLATWQGRPRYRDAHFEKVQLFCLDGRANERVFQQLMQYLSRARERVIVHSPYLMDPVLHVLTRLSRRGLRVVIITPEYNNRRFLKHYIQRRAAEAGLELHFYQPRMSHLKAILIDSHHLIVGSSNFDYWSYRIHPEIVAIISLPTFIQEFEERVVQTDLAQSRPFSPSTDSRNGHWGDLSFRLIRFSADICKRWMG